MRLDSSGAMIDSRPIPVMAFVDWNSQIHNANVTPDDPHERARRTLMWTSRTIGRALTRQEPASRFNVTFRLYTAEAWTRPHGGRAFIVRNRRSDAFLKLDGLLLEVKQ